MEYDLAEIQESGELIGGTLSGPDTYFEYRGRGFGLQFEVAEDFGRQVGARLRMEVAHDTAELVQMLRRGDVDFIAMPMPQTQGTLQCRNQWLTRDNSPQLAEAVDAWYDPSIVSRLRQQAQRQERVSHTVRRKPRPAVLNAAKGQICRYDAYLQRAAALVGWDWRLLAAQCYQESAFDPQAESWAGAQGLMQIMPGTAAHLGVAGRNIWDAETNIMAGARYLRELQQTFSDIPDPRERTRFVLAAYNGGAGHVRDAMALAAKNGRPTQRWSDVSPYILRLSQPRYYCDPVVKCGYMRGSETEGYVRQIEQRWQQYRSMIRPSAGRLTNTPAENTLPADSL